MRIIRLWLVFPSKSQSSQKLNVVGSTDTTVCFLPWIASTLIDSTQSSSASCFSHHRLNINFNHVTLNGVHYCSIQSRKLCSIIRSATASLQYIQVGNIHLTLGSLLCFVCCNTATSTTNLFALILRLLDLFARWFSLLHQPVPDASEFRLKLFCSLNIIIDAAEASGLSTTEVSEESRKKDGRHVVTWVHLAKKFLKLRLWNIGPTGMDNINNHLPAWEQGITDELARS